MSPEEYATHRECLLQNIGHPLGESASVTEAAA